MHYFIIIATLLYLSLINGCNNYKPDNDVPAGMVMIPSGETIIGANAVDDKGGTKVGKDETEKKVPLLFVNESPEHKVYLGAFYISKYEVTNIQYASFDTLYKYPADKQNHPVSNISWYDANRYCMEKGQRLPSEAEWEKTARGPHGNIYPWGNEFDTAKANTSQSNIGSTTPVGVYENGKSFYGVYDMIGNVAEWTDSWYEPYPLFSKNRVVEHEKRYKIIRGSSWGGIGHYKKLDYNMAILRRIMEPSANIPDVGFRCAK